MIFIAYLNLIGIIGKDIRVARIVAVMAEKGRKGISLYPPPKAKIPAGLGGAIQTPSKVSSDYCANSNKLSP